MEELLSCPFCGSDSVIWSDLFQRVRCNSCYIGTPSQNPAGARTDESAAALKDRAIKEWNTRTPLLSVESALAELREMFPDTWIELQQRYTYSTFSRERSGHVFIQIDKKGIVGATLELAMQAVREWKESQQ